MQYIFISDKKNQERRSHIQNITKQLDLHPVFFDAIMGNELSSDELKLNSYVGTFLSPGEIGCALSHLQIYREFLESSEKSMLIFEDDIEFHNGLTKSLLFDIQTAFHNIEEPAVLVLYHSPYAYKKISSVNAQVSIHACHNLFYTHAYFINRQGAENILQIQTPVRFEIDAFKFYHWLNKLDLYCLNKDFVLQSSPLATINNIERDWSDRRTPLKNKMFAHLYQQLSTKDKLNVLRKRIKKAWHQLF